MLKKLKQSWRRFQLNDPGQRFQSRYHQQRKSGHGMLRRAFYVGAGLFLLAIGIFFLPAPGPGLVIMFLGAGLLAQESLWVARALDWADLGWRNTYAKYRSHGVSPVLKVLLAFAALVLFAALTFGIYRLVAS